MLIGFVWFTFVPFDYVYSVQSSFLFGRVDIFVVMVSSPDLFGLRFCSTKILLHYYYHSHCRIDFGKCRSLSSSLFRSLSSPQDVNGIRKFVWPFLPFAFVHRLFTYLFIYYMGKKCIYIPFMRV